MRRFTQSFEHRERYNSVAISLHWLMALAFFWMLASGVAMTNLELGQSLKFQTYQWHKASGVLLLATFVARVIWRFVSNVPSLPAHLSKLDQLAAKLGHAGLYVLMLALPLSGWVMVSSSVYGLPTLVFGLFEWPHIPDIQGNKLVEQRAKDVHFVLTIAFAVMIVAHVGAVIKHRIFDNENLLTRMWWTKGNGEIS